MLKAFRAMPLRSALVLAFAATGCFRADVLGEDELLSDAGIGGHMSGGSAARSASGGMVGNDTGGISSEAGWRASQAAQGCPVMAAEWRAKTLG
jgi:hypothetical protein